MSRWTHTQRCLGAAGVVLLVLAVERLTNAVMLRGHASWVALGVSCTLGLAGAVSLMMAWLLSFVAGALRSPGEMDVAGAHDRKASR